MIVAVDRVRCANYHASISYHVPLTLHFVIGFVFDNRIIQYQYPRNFVEVGRSWYASRMIFHWFILLELDTSGWWTLASCKYASRILWGLESEMDCFSLCNSNTLMAWWTLTEACRPIHLANSLFWLRSAQSGTVLPWLSRISSTTSNYSTSWTTVKFPAYAALCKGVCPWLLGELYSTLHCTNNQSQVFRTNFPNQWVVVQPQLFGWCGFAFNSSTKYIAVDKWHCHIANSNQHLLLLMYQLAHHI